MLHFALVAYVIAIFAAIVGYGDLASKDWTEPVFVGGLTLFAMSTALAVWRDHGSHLGSRPGRRSRIGSARVVGRQRVWHIG